MRSKQFTLLGLFLLLITASCKEDKEKITYELTLSASQPISGRIVFSEIKYNDGKMTQTLTNQTDDFSTKLMITPGFSIDFSAKGTITNRPVVLLPFITYRVDRITDGYLRYTVCEGQSVTTSGSGTTVTFDAAFKRTFSTMGCQ